MDIIDLSQVIFLGCVRMSVCIYVYTYKFRCGNTYIYAYVLVRNFLSASEWFIFISWLSFLSFNENDYILSIQIQVGDHVNVVRHDSFVPTFFFSPFFFDWVSFAWRSVAARFVLSLAVPCRHVSIFQCGWCIVLRRSNINRPYRFCLTSRRDHYRVN